MTVRKVVLDSESPKIGFRHKTLFGLQGCGSILFFDSGVIVFNPWSSSNIDGREHVRIIEITRVANKAFMRLTMREGWTRGKAHQSSLYKALGMLSARVFPPVIFGTNELIDGEILNPEAIDAFVGHVTKCGFIVSIKVQE